MVYPAPTLPANGVSFPLSEVDKEMRDYVAENSTILFVNPRAQQIAAVLASIDVAFSVMPVATDDSPSSLTYHQGLNATQITSLSESLQAIYDQVKQIETMTNEMISDLPNALMKAKMGELADRVLVAPADACDSYDKYLGLLMDQGEALLITAQSAVLSFLDNAANRSLRNQFDTVTEIVETVAEDTTESVTATTTATETVLSESTSSALYNSILQFLADPCLGGLIMASASPEFLEKLTACGFEAGSEEA